MSSVNANVKTLTSPGYYVNVADTRTRFYMNNGTDSAPAMSTNYYAVSSVTSTYMATAGSAVFRDHGKTLVSANRVFRKVQLMVSTGSVNVGGSDGVAGVDNSPVNYLTGYIELPGLGGSGSGNVAGSGITPVARLG
jgi:hypothetical protein